MDIKLFFDPIEEESLLDTGKPGSFRSIIDINEGLGTPVEGKRIGLFTVGDELIALRKELYQLKKGKETYSILDFGTLRDDGDPQNTIDRIAEATALLIDKGITPIMIGGSHRFMMGQYLGFRDLKREINLANIDSKFDIEEEDGLTENNHIYAQLTFQPGYLHKFSQIGFQQYLNAPEVVNLFEKMQFEKYRLGEVRANIELVEPILRMADLISFDLCALKKSDFSSKNDVNPFGLTGEEACRLSWYAGISDQLLSMSFLGYKEKENPSDHMVLATMIWYFIEGFYHKIDDKDFKGPSYTKYAVMIEKQGITLDFYKHNISGKWWMKDANDFIVACSYEDYELASKGDIPSRWIKH